MGLVSASGESSLMVITVELCKPSTPPAGLLSVSVNVSLPSRYISSLINNWKVLLVSPAAKLMVPAAYSKPSTQTQAELAAGFFWSRTSTVSTWGPAGRFCVEKRVACDCEVAEYRSTCCCMDRTLVIVKLGSTSAKVRVSSGSSVPGDALVTSMIPPMKCDRSSIFFIRSFL